MLNSILMVQGPPERLNKPKNLFFEKSEKLWKNDDDDDDDGPVLGPYRPVSSCSYVKALKYSYICSSIYGARRAAPAHKAFYKIFLYFSNIFNEI